MAENDKNIRLSLSQPLYSVVQKKGYNTLILNLPKLMILLCSGLIGLNFLNLAAACGTAFTCFRFTPSLDYLGCFRGHDRIYMVACVYTAIILGLLFFGAYNRFRNLYGPEMQTVMIGVKLSIIILLPFIGYTNEVNAEHFMSFEIAHNLLLKLFMILCAVWVLMHYRTIKKVQSKLNKGESNWFTILFVSMIAMVVMGGILMLQRSWQYTENANWWINENGASATEWAMVTLASLLPIVFSQFLRGFQFSISTKGEEIIRAETELNEFGNN